MEVGQTIGRYQILERIGAGGMGEVYRAVDLELHRLVAIKSIRGALRADPKAVTRLRREALIIASIDHPYICRIYELLQFESELALVMEFVDGRTLESSLKEGPLKQEAALRLAIEVSEALDAAHAKGIVHRDVKPSNLMITLHRHVKVMDFGIAKEGFGTPWSTTAGETPTALTEEGAFLGTPRYCAPEQITRGEVDSRSDLFCLGAVLYQCLAGRLPFEGETDQVYLKSVLSEPPRPFGDPRSAGGRQFQSIILKCLEKDPGNRYQTAAALLADLRAIVEPPRQPRRPGRIKRALGYTLAGAAIVVALVVAFVASHREAPTPPLIPATKHIVLLPFSSASKTADASAFARGLSLVTAEEFDRAAPRIGPGVWAASATSMTTDWEKDKARRRSLGATLALDGRVTESAGALRIDMELFLTPSWKRIASGRIEEPFANVGTFQDGPALKLAEMIGSRSTDLRPLLQKNNTPIASSLRDYLTACGYLNGQSPGSAERQAAIRLLLDAVRDDPVFAAAYNRLAEAYLEEYRAGARTALEQAETSALKAVTIDGGNGEYQLNLGRVFKEEGKLKEAESSLQQAARLGATPALIELGKLYAALNLPDKAAQALLEATQARPGYSPYLNELGLFYYHSGDYAGAVKAFDEMTKAMPDNIRAWNNLGGISIYLDQWERARQSFQKSLEVEESFFAYSNLGALDYEEGRFADSMAHFQKAIEIDDSEYGVWGNLGSAARLTPGQQARAKTAFEKAITLAKAELHKEPDNQQAMVDLASYYAELGDHENARACLARLDQANPKDPDTLVRMGEACAYLNDLPQARRFIEKALELGYPKAKLQRIPELRRLSADASFVGLFQ